MIRQLAGIQSWRSAPTAIVHESFSFDWQLSVASVINQGIAREGKTIRNIRSAWIKEQQCEDGKITEYQVNLSITFVLDE